MSKVSRRTAGHAVPPGPARLRSRFLRQRCPAIPAGRLCGALLPSGGLAGPTLIHPPTGAPGAGELREVPREEAAHDRQRDNPGGLGPPEPPPQPAAPARGTHLLASAPFGSSPGRLEATA